MNFLFNINVCRVCMQNEQKTCDLFQDKDLLEKFTSTTHLAVTLEDNLPKVICSNCAIRLKIAYKFIQTAHNSASNLKKFLAKISNEFKEVAQSNKHDHSKDNDMSGSDHNLSRDEMLTLMGEDEASGENISISSSNNERHKAKRIGSPIKEPSLLKNFKVENKTSDKGAKPENYQNTVDSKIVRPDVLFLQPQNNETEPENEIIVEEEQQEELTIQDKIQEEILQPDNQNQHEVENQTDHEHEMSIGDDLGLEQVEGKSRQKGENQYLEGTNHHESQLMLTINEASSETSATELTELTLEENQFHHALEQNSPVIKTTETDQDGFLREYETMLSTHDNELQYGTDYIEENSSEEIRLKDEEICIQKLEEEQETYADIGDNEDNSQSDHSHPLFTPATVSQREKIVVKSSRDSYQNRFYCEQCNRDFSTKTNLNRHMQSHEGNKPHVCTECSKSFSQKSTLKQHMYIHTGERPFVCDVCDRGFTQCKSLIFHMRRHTGEKPFQCEYCLITFRQKDALRIHILKYHVITEQLPNGKETYTCIICQKQFKSKSAFKIHMKIHTAITEPDNMEIILDDSVDNVTTAKQTKPNNLTVVQPAFLEDENIDAAIMDVSASSASEPRRAKKLQCRKCFKCFALKKSLIRHMSIHYTNVEEDITECSDCDLQFENVEEYQEHLTEHHQFACSACPHMIFKTLQDLKIHMLEHALDEQEQEKEELI